MGEGSGEILCHDIYPARPITTVFLVANTYCMMDSLSSCASHPVGSRVQFSSACERNDRPEHTVGYHLLSVVPAVTNTESLNPALANSHRSKRTPSNPLCLSEILISEYALS